MHRSAPNHHISNIFKASPGLYPETPSFLYFARTDMLTHISHRTQIVPGQMCSIEVQSFNPGSLLCTSYECPYSSLIYCADRHVVTWYSVPSRAIGLHFSRVSIADSEFYHIPPPLSTPPSTLPASPSMHPKSGDPMFLLTSGLFHDSFC